MTAGGNEECMLLLLLLASAFAQSPPVFDPGPRFVHPPNVEPSSLRSADFNQDGKADLVTASPGTREVFVFMGSGDGTLLTAIRIPNRRGPKRNPCSTASFVMPIKRARSASAVVRPCF